METENMNVKMVDAAEVEQDKILRLEENKEINIPDIDKLSTGIIRILEFMNRKEMKELRKQNVVEYEKRIETTFPTFVDNFYSIYKMLLSGQDITNLLHMLRSLNKVKQNKLEFEQARDEMSAIVNKQFVAPAKKKADKRMKNKRK